MCLNYIFFCLCIFVCIVFVMYTDVVARVQQTMKDSENNKYKLIPQIRIFSSMIKIIICLMDCVGKYKNVRQFQSNQIQNKFNHIFFNSFKTRSCRYLGNDPDDLEICMFQQKWEKEAATVYRRIQDNQRSQNGLCEFM